MPEKKKLPDEVPLGQAGAVKPVVELPEKKKLPDEVPALGRPISAEEAGLPTEPEATAEEWAIIREAFGELEALLLRRRAQEMSGVQRMRALVNCERFADVGATVEEEALVKRLAARLGGMKRLCENVNRYIWNM